LVAIVDFKQWEGMDLYSFQVMWSGHSWMGALTVALWGVQFIFSVWMHAIAKWPEGTEDTKAFLNEIHKFVGYCVYVVGLSSCASGFEDMQAIDYAGLQSEAVATKLANPSMTEAQMIEMSTPGLGNELASVGETRICDESEMHIVIEMEAESPL
jgi:Eukaryotic cytochrome b561